MKRVAIGVLTALLCGSLSSSAGAAQSDRALIAALQSNLNSYLAKRAKIEHISAVSLAISLHGRPTIALAAGRVGTDRPSAPATPSSLFQIGSNTKAVTATLILDLEAQHRLRVTDRLGKWLPQYPAWKNVTIAQSLDMTSGIPTYDNDPAFQRLWARNPYRHFSAPELIAAVYPKNGRAVFQRGWHYSNTGYILSQLIIERAGGLNYANALQKGIFQRLHLGDMYYDPNRLSPELIKRVVHGYFASDDPDNTYLAPLFGKDMRDMSLSWAQAAGGIIATPSAMIPWLRALYTGNAMPAAQRSELMQTVSMRSGKPVAKLTTDDSRDFGLGVGRALFPGMGVVWFYEGMTLGYRVLHVWIPKSDAVIVVAANSQPRAKDNALGSMLMVDVYKTLRALKAL